MKPRLIALSTLFGAAVVLGGCQQERNNESAASPVRDVPAETRTAATTAQPAQVPPGDPSLPPRGTPAEATSGTDPAHSALTPAENKNALPLEGQPNSHSSDAFAKRGDDNTVRDSPDSPRGNEAIATPNSYAKEPK